MPFPTHPFCQPHLTIYVDIAISSDLDIAHWATFHHSETLSLSCVTQGVNRPIMSTDISLKQPSSSSFAGTEKLIGMTGACTLQATAMLTAAYKLDQSTVFTLCDGLGRQISSEQSTLHWINPDSETFSYQTRFLPRFWGSLTNSHQGAV